MNPLVFAPAQQIDPGLSVVVDRVLESPLIVLIAGAMFFLSIAAVIMVLNTFRQTTAQIRTAEAMSTQSATLNVQVGELGRMVGQVGALQSAIASGDRDLVEKLTGEIRDRHTSLTTALDKKLTSFQSAIKTDYDKSAEERTQRVTGAITSHDQKTDRQHDTVVSLLHLLRGQVRDDNKVLVDELTRKLEERHVIPSGTVPEPAPEPAPPVVATLVTPPPTVETSEEQKSA